MEQVEAKPIEPELDCPKPYGPDDLCDSNPEFAVICSFIRQFGDKIDLELDIEQLKCSIEDQETLADHLIDVHVKLLKKLRRYFVRDHWEKALIRYAYEYSYEHGYELETLGYLKTRPSIKLQLLRRLLDAQFECDQKFKAVVNTDEASKLRTQPLGRDYKGNIYWHFDDKEGHLRVYTEEPLDHRSWKLLCKNPDELDYLIDELDKTKDDKIKGEPQTEPYNPYPDIFPEYFIKSEKEADEEKHDNKVSTRKQMKKGRRSRAPRKSSPPAILSVVDDIKPDVAIKVETEPDDDNALTTLEFAKNDAPVQSQIDHISQTNSIESQVKQTLDALLSKVATSFDFFFRWNNNNSDKKEEPVKKPRGRNSKREKVLPEEVPRRSSSRIQLLQQRKITEYIQKEASQRKVSEVEVKVPKQIREDVVPNNSRPKKSATKNKQRWRIKGKKKLSWDKDDSDLSSISSLTDSNDESFVEELNGALDPEPTQDSDEFACEEEETNDAPVIIKRARTARQIVDSEEGSQLNNSSIIEEDKPCARCDKSNDPDWILLCDMCDDGYHTACCIPPLMFVPDGDWFCLPCEHKTLLSKLRDISSTLKEVLAEKERERQKRQRLRQAFKKTAIKPANDEILPEKPARTRSPKLNLPLTVLNTEEILGESSGQELSDSYRERAYRQPKKKKRKSKQVRNKRRRTAFIDDEEEDYEYSFNKSSRKTYSRRTLHDTESEEDLPSDDQLISEDGITSSEISNDGSQLKTRKARACVSYRFQEYDELIQSAIRADSDDPLSTNEDPPEEEPASYGRGKDMATIEAIAYQQENGINDQEMTVASANDESKKPAKTAKTRKKGRRLNDLDAESEIDIATSDDSFQAASETDDEEEEEELTEIDSEDESSIDEIVCVRSSKSKIKKRNRKQRNCYESDESYESDEFAPRSRRNASKRVSYKESTDEDEPFKKSQPSESSSSPHPSFYEEDEIRPTTHSTSNDKQEPWS